MKLDKEYIKRLPLTTNKINVTLDKNAFFSRYSIVSYYGTNKELKNLAYEQLADVPCLVCNWHKVKMGRITLSCNSLLCPDRQR